MQEDCGGVCATLLCALFRTTVAHYVVCAVHATHADSDGHSATLRTTSKLADTLAHRRIPHSCRVPPRPSSSLLLRRSSIAQPHLILSLLSPAAQMVQCNYCNLRSAVLKRPKTGEKICKDCFFVQFELEVHQTIVANELFRRGERVAIAASGGKDSTVLAHVLTKLNRQHDYGLNLFLLSIDEGITGYRDDSLESVKRNQADYDVPLLIVGYQELYGWSMDAIVEAIGKKNNCTFCGVFRRQALDRGAVLLKADKICTGHNADDMAETVLMNLLRGDIARLQRCTHITTGRGTDSTLPRCKPFKVSSQHTHTALSMPLRMMALCRERRPPPVFLSTHTLCTLRLFVAVNALACASSTPTRRKS